MSLSHSLLLVHFHPPPPLPLKFISFFLPRPSQSALSLSRSRTYTRSLSPSTRIPRSRSSAASTALVPLTLLARNHPHTSQSLLPATNRPPPSPCYIASSSSRSSLPTFLPRPSLRRRPLFILALSTFTRTTHYSSPSPSPPSPLPGAPPPVAANPPPHRKRPLERGAQLFLLSFPLSRAHTRTPAHTYILCPARCLSPRARRERERERATPGKILENPARNLTRSSLTSRACARTRVRV